MIDDLTLEITLDSPDASLPRTFLTYGQIPVLPKHKVEALPEETRFNNTDPYWYTNPVGTGPYKFVQYVEDQYIEYERNEEYWGGTVGPEKLFLKISSPEVAMIALEKGEIDYMYPTNLSEIKRLQANPNIELIEAKNSAQFFGLIPNYMTMDGAWRDPKVKQALLHVGRPPGLRQHHPAGLRRRAQQPDGWHAVRLPDHEEVGLRPGQGGPVVDGSRLAEGEARRVDHGLHVVARQQASP